MSFDLQIECFSEKSTWRLSVLSYTRGLRMFCSAVWCNRKYNIKNMTFVWCSYVFSAVLNDGVNFNSRNKISVTSLLPKGYRKRWLTVTNRRICLYMFVVHTTAFSLAFWQKVISEKSTWRLSVLSYTGGLWMFLFCCLSVTLNII